MTEILASGKINMTYETKTENKVCSHTANGHDARIQAGLHRQQRATKTYTDRPKQERTPLERLNKKRVCVWKLRTRKSKIWSKNCGTLKLPLTIKIYTNPLFSLYIVRGRRGNGYTLQRFISVVKRFRVLMVEKIT